MKTYLEPLKKETFLSNTEINALFGNIQEIFGFQQQFLQTLENALETEAQFLNLDSPSQFKVRYLIIPAHCGLTWLGIIAIRYLSQKIDITCEEVYYIEENAWDNLEIPIPIKNRFIRANWEFQI